MAQWLTAWSQYPRNKGSNLAQANIYALLHLFPVLLNIPNTSSQTIFSICHSLFLIPPWNLAFSELKGKISNRFINFQILFRKGSFGMTMYYVYWNSKNYRNWFTCSRYGPRVTEVICMTTDSIFMPNNQLLLGMKVYMYACLFDTFLLQSLLVLTNEM